jgi:hypothetical protein
MAASAHSTGCVVPVSRQVTQRAANDRAGDREQEPVRCVRVRGGRWPERNCSTLHRHGHRVGIRLKGSGCAYSVISSRSDGEHNRLLFSVLCSSCHNEPPGARLKTGLCLGSAWFRMVFNVWIVFITRFAPLSAEKRYTKDEDPA